jgi:inositol-phosphate phosphatase/L-galactose 1-phosphate phosphatase
MPKRKRGDGIELDDVLTLAKQAVEEAGGVIREAWGTGVSRNAVEQTKDTISIDLVTKTDRECEKLIIDHIKSKFPSHVIIGEESSGTDYELTDAPTWTIDPVDGTTNFIHRFPFTCVLVSFLVGKEVKVAVTLDPVHCELYWATKDKGAWLKSEAYEGRIQTSGTKHISSAVIGIECGYGRDALTTNNLTSAVAGLMKKGVRALRLVGAGGLNLTMVACGKTDGFFEEGSKELNSGPKVSVCDPLLLRSPNGAQHLLLHLPPTHSHCLRRTRLLSRVGYPHHCLMCYRYS